jgi:hypothetical protein
MGKKKVTDKEKAEALRKNLLRRKSQARISESKTVDKQHNKQAIRS